MATLDELLRNRQQYGNANVQRDGNSFTQVGAGLPRITPGTPAVNPARVPPAGAGQRGRERLATLGNNLGMMSNAFGTLQRNAFAAPAIIADAASGNPDQQQRALRAMMPPDRSAAPAATAAPIPPPSGPSLPQSPARPSGQSSVQPQTRANASLAQAYQQLGASQRQAPQTIDVAARGRNPINPTTAITRQMADDGTVTYRAPGGTATFSGRQPTDAQGNAVQPQGLAAFQRQGLSQPVGQGGTLSAVQGSDPFTQLAALQDLNQQSADEAYRFNLQRGRGQFARVNPERRAALLAQFDQGQLSRDQIDTQRQTSQAQAQQQAKQQQIENQLAAGQLEAQQTSALANLMRAQNAGQPATPDYGSIYQDLLGEYASQQGLGLDEGPAPEQQAMSALGQIARLQGNVIGPNGEVMAIDDFNRQIRARAEELGVSVDELLTAARNQGALGL